MTKAIRRYSGRPSGIMFFPCAREYRPVCTQLHQAEALAAVVQRQVLYLGEINDGQQQDWCRAIEPFDEGTRRHTQLALFPADRAKSEHAIEPPATLTQDPFDHCLKAGEIAKRSQLSRLVLHDLVQTDRGQPPQRG
jgi:hypothetical protein